MNIFKGKEMNTPNHHIERVADVDIHYVRLGSGPPLVLLHGWPETWYAWRHVIPILAQHYTVIAPDLRGLGDSSKPASGYEKRVLAEDVYQLVTHLGFSSIFLVGHDWGGSTAYAYAAAHRDQVRRLVIVESLVLSGLPERDAVFGPETWFAQFHSIPHLAEAVVTGRERAYLSWFYDAFPARKDAIMDADREEYLRTYSDPRALHAGFELYRTHGHDLEDNRISAQQPLQLPILAIGGDRSMGSRTQEALEVLATHVRGEVLNNCGHFVPEEYPTVLAEHILRFFAEEEHVTSSV
jgi:pimeloyl-ACP methyl ester carboxylesterase